MLYPKGGSLMEKFNCTVRKLIKFYLFLQVNLPGGIILTCVHAIMVNQLLGGHCTQPLTHRQPQIPYGVYHFHHHCFYQHHIHHQCAP